MDLSSVKLSIDGNNLPATATKAGNLITINYQPTAVFVSGSQHTAGITYTAGGVARTETWAFSVETYPTLTQAQQAVSVDKTKPGFIWRVFQNEGAVPNDMDQAELALAGKLTAGGAVLPNLADTNAIGVAAGIGVPDGPVVKFEIPTVINLSQVGGEANGNFTPDDQMPGIPGTTGLDNGIDAEILTFLDLPAGLLTMGVNSDDGFRTLAGYTGSPTNAMFMGEFNGPTGRGAADTLFKIYVRDAGLYPFRTTWQEGGGGANIEWFTVKSDGTKVLVNDTANGGVPAYRVGVAPNPPAQFRLNLQSSGGQLELTWTEAGVILQESTDLKTWTDRATATSPFRVTPAPGASVFYRLKK